MGLVIALALVCGSDYTPQQERLLSALIQVESGGKDDAVGDAGRAIGALQIWRVYWLDAVERSSLGGSYKDCYRRSYAKAVTSEYFKRYAQDAWNDPKAFDAEKCARIHNGGPKGHTKKATLKYWEKVKKVLTKPSKHV